nr:8260_t:CDS:2 [Entrophospora candida]
MISEQLSVATGIPEPTLRLILTILFSYPTALFYRFLFLRPLKTKWAPFLRNLYCLITGLLLSYFYNRSNIKHSLLTTVVTWTFCYLGTIINNRRISCAAAFIFNFTYLLCGYYFNATDDYDINWTMTQCVLCLRMIGFAMDFMDGEKLLKSNPPKNQLINDKKVTSSVTPPPSSLNGTELTARNPAPKLPRSFEKNIQLATLPSLIETIAYAHFFGAFLIGPQFSFHLYRKFITMSIFPDANKIPPGSYKHALKCFTLGALYLLVRQIGAGSFPASYLLTDEYLNLPFFKRLLIMWATGKFAFSKYLGVWSLTEGSCALSGISFNGYDDNGKPEWNCLSNVDKWKFEFATSLNAIVGSFNTNTNLWTKIYIFKRLIFLGNKNLSNIGALLFLALWHGLHIGYFICFSLEFLDMEGEKRWAKRFESYTKPLYYNDKESLSSIKTQTLKKLHLLLCWIGQTSALYYSMISFELLKLEHIVIAYNSVYWIVNGEVIVNGGLKVKADIKI